MDKKYKNVFFFLLLIICVSSCTSENKYNEYCDKYYEYHPNSYVFEEQWYEFNSTSSYFYENGSESIISTRFVGKIKFNNDSFQGTTDKFVLETETINYYPNNLVTITYTYDSLSDSIWYSKETNINVSSNEEVVNIEGRNDLAYVDINLLFDDIIFSPNECNQNNYEINWRRDFGIIFINTAFEDSFLSSNYFYEYGFDEDFKLNVVRRTISSMYTLDTTTRFINQATLNVCDEKEINCIETDKVSKEHGPIVLKNGL